jgi:8-oxo-dGTP pyrophosphatase MutT (NUDIX family)
MDFLSRHITACNNAVLPGRRLPFRIGAVEVGWVLPDLASALADFAGVTVAADGVTLAAEAAGTLPEIARTLAAAGRFRWRDEAFDIREKPGGPVLARIDRGALPKFGLLSEGVHLNGLVRRGDELLLWVARRAADKALDPGKLDHIVAGGIAAGMTPWQTLIKEAAEEAAISAELARTAVKVAEIGYAMERPEGLRRDLLYCYDLLLPDDFIPHAADGEVEAFYLWPIERVVETVRRTDDFKFNVNLVLIDLFRRFGLVTDCSERTLPPGC